MRHNLLPHPLAIDPFELDQLSSAATTSSRSLKRKLLFPLLATGALVAALAVWAIHAMAEKQFLEKLSQRAELVAHTMNYAAERVSQGSNLDRIVSGIGAEKGCVSRKRHADRGLICPLCRFST
jgi:hypothetical protein